MLKGIVKGLAITAGTYTFVATCGFTAAYIGRVHHDLQWAKCNPAEKRVYIKWLVRRDLNEFVEMMKSETGEN